MKPSTVKLQVGSERSMDTTNGKEQSWWFWFLVPLYPYLRRRTVRQEFVP